MKMEVPDWFARLGSVPDKDIAVEEGIPRPTVTIVRQALHIKPWTQSRRDDRTWAKVQELVASGLPRHMWPPQLGFEPQGRFTARACMDEWLYCYENELEYDMARPRIAVPQPLDTTPRTKRRF